MKIEQTFREALRILVKIWPYVLPHLALSLVSLVLSQQADDFLLLCLMLPITLIIYLFGILLLRVMFYALDDKDLQFSKVIEGLMPAAWRILAFSFGSSIAFGVLFSVIASFAILFVLIVPTLIPALHMAIIVVSLAAIAITVITLLLLLGMYSPLVMGAIVDRNQGLRNAVREAHTLLKANWKKLLGWVLILTVPNSLIAMLLGAFGQQSTDMALSATLIYITGYLAVTVLGLFLQSSWAIIYRQLSQPDITTKARHGRVSST